MVVATEDDDWLCLGGTPFVQLGDDVVGEVVKRVVSLRLVADFVLVFIKEGLATSRGGDGANFPPVSVRRGGVQGKVKGKI